MKKSLQDRSIQRQKRKKRIVCLIAAIIAVVMLVGTIAPFLMSVR